MKSLNLPLAVQGLSVYLDLTGRETEAQRKTSQDRVSGRTGEGGCVTTRHLAPELVLLIVPLQAR